MATRRSSKKPTMVAEAAPAPLPKAPQTMVPETEDGEWEEVLLCSYTPMPVVWDEHPTAQKLEKLLEKLEFQVHSEDSNAINTMSACFSLDRRSLSIVPPIYSANNPIHDFSRTSTGYQKNPNRKLFWSNLNLERGQRWVRTAPSGKFTIVLVRTFDGSTAWLWRLDFGSDEPTKLLEVPAQQPLVGDHGWTTLSGGIWVWTSDSYAYFSCRDLVFRVDVRTGERSIVFQAERAVENGGFTYKEHLHGINPAQLGKGRVALLYPRSYVNGDMRLRILDERTNTTLKVVDAQVGFKDYWCQYALLREGLVVKFNTGNKHKPNMPRLQNHYALHRLDNLQLVTKFVVDNSCQYSKNWFSINYFRITGFPVFIEAVFIDRQKYFFSLSVLFRSRFHNLTCPCPIDMRYKFVAAILTPVQHDQRLTELVVCVKQVKTFKMDKLHILKLQI